MRPALSPHPCQGGPGGFYPPHVALRVLRLTRHLTFDLFVQRLALPLALPPGLLGTDPMTPACPDFWAARVGCSRSQGLGDGQAWEQMLALSSSPLTFGVPQECVTSEVTRSSGDGASRWTWGRHIVIYLSLLAERRGEL